MDYTSAIQEIAKQLGVATDTLMQNIAYYLPYYANMRICQVVSVLLILAIVVLVFLLIYRAMNNKVLRDDAIPDGEPHLLNRDLYYFYDGARYVAVGISVVMAIVFVCYALYAVPQLIGWATCPEGQLVHDVIHLMTRK